MVLVHCGPLVHLSQVAGVCTSWYLSQVVSVDCVLVSPAQSLLHSSGDRRCPLHVWCLMAPHVVYMITNAASTSYAVPLAFAKCAETCGVVWCGCHVLCGTQDCPFVVRGPTYLKDRKKIPAGHTQFVFAAMDVVELPYAVEHVARFLPSVR